MCVCFFKTESHYMTTATAAQLKEAWRIAVQELDLAVEDQIRATTTEEELLASEVVLDKWIQLHDAEGALEEHESLMALLE